MRHKGSRFIGKRFFLVYDFLVKLFFITADFFIKFPIKVIFWPPGSNNAKPTKQPNKNEGLHSKFTLVD